MSSPLDTPRFFKENRSAEEASFRETFALNGSSLRLPAERLSPNGGGPSVTPRVGPTVWTAPARVIRVLVADPHELFREGLTHHLAGLDDLCVVAAVSSNCEALAACSANDVDVLVCAGECSSLSPEPLASALRASSPETRVLVLCSHETLTEEEALRAGAWGVVCRRQSADHFVRSIRAIADGQLWASRETLSRLAQIELSDTHEATPKKPRPLLSARESEIVALLSAGLTNDAIAEKLYVESSTIRTHLRRIFRKLNVHDRRSATLAAVLIGTVPLRGLAAEQTSRKTPT